MYICAHCETNFLKVANKEVEAQSTAELGRKKMIIKRELAYQHKTADMSGFLIILDCCTFTVAQRTLGEHHNNYVERWKWEWETSKL